MSKQDQINHLTNDILSLFRSESMSKAMASLLYDKGYRRASDIAREIFEEIENAWRGAEYYEDLAIAFAEIKKKYTEGEG